MMNLIRCTVALVVLGLGFASAPTWAQTRPTGTKRPTTTTTTGTTTGSTTGSASRTPVKKPTTTTVTEKKPETTAKPATKPAKKKTKAEPLPYGLGLKIGFMPYNSMSATVKGGGENDYNMKMAYGFGLEGHYRLAARFYLTGELMYWFTQISKVGKKSYDAEAKDGLLNTGVGLKVFVYGKETAANQIYAKGTVGYSQYMADDDNLKGNDRIGVYYGLGAGITHRMGERFRLFAETGLYWNSYSTVGEGENEATLFNWQGTGGFLYLWK